MGDLVPDIVVRVRRSHWLLLAVLVVLVVLALGALRRPSSVAGNSTTASLSVVPTTLSVTVSPGTTKFGNCSGGGAPASTPTALGYPNGRCSVGMPGAAGSFPITISNKGKAADIYVNGSNAVPSDNGTHWRLCNQGAHPAVACTGPAGLPGADQYVAENFASGGQNPNGLTDAPACDDEFVSPGCSATTGQSQSEGIELIGPTQSADTSTSWTVTITWTAVAP